MSNIDITKSYPINCTYNPEVIYNFQKHLVTNELTGSLPNKQNITENHLQSLKLQIKESTKCSDWIAWTDRSVSREEGKSGYAYLIEDRDSGKAYKCSNPYWKTSSSYDA